MAHAYVDRGDEVEDSRMCTSRDRFMHDYRRNDEGDPTANIINDIN